MIILSQPLTAAAHTVGRKEGESAGVGIEEGASEELTDELVGCIMCVCMCPCAHASAWMCMRHTITTLHYTAAHHQLWVVAIKLSHPFA